MTSDLLRKVLMFAIVGAAVVFGTRFLDTLLRKV